MIEIPSWGNVTLIEALWLASGVAAVVVTFWRMPVLWRDYHWTTRDGQADLRLIARGYLRREIVRFLQGVLICVIGTYAAVKPPLVPGPAMVTTVGLILTAVLIGISLLVSVQSILDWYDRARVQEIVRRP